MRWGGVEVPNEIAGVWKVANAAFPAQRKPERGLKGCEARPVTQSVIRVVLSFHGKLYGFLLFCVRSLVYKRRKGEYKNSPKSLVLVFISVPSESSVMV